MIDPNLFAEVQALDRVQHRQLRANFGTVRHDRAARMNSMFVAAVEFGDVCREYPIVFVDAGKGEDGQAEYAPIAVLGLAQGENLFVQADGGWGAHYVPALLRGYPFAIARAENDNFFLVVDVKHAGLSADQGERLFDDQGEPSAALDDRRKFVEEFEREAQRTRIACRQIAALGLLSPMRFDATLPDGTQVGVDGFHTVNEERMAALTDAQIVDAQRSGLLGLIHAHQISLGLMRRLVERRLERAAANRP